MNVIKINNTLNINDWNNYINKKKIILIDKLDDNNNILDSSQDSFNFNTILKSIVKINIFNISYITFMKLKFLETSFIPSEVLLNIIEIYSDVEMYNILNEKTKIKNNTNTTNTANTNDTYKYIKTLKFIINMIIDFVVKAEVSLNIQCLLITNFIDKITNINTTTTNILQNDNNLKPKIFKLFNKSNTSLCNNIKSSSIILLFFKLINKLNITNSYDNNNYDDEIINLLQETKDNNLNNYINKHKNINKKTKIYLDSFILEITKYFNIEQTNNYICLDIHTICSKYILNNIELMFNNFENIFSVLETHLLKSININEKLKIKLVHLRNFIINLANIEIDNINKLFSI